MKMTAFLMITVPPPTTCVHGNNNLHVEVDGTSSPADHAGKCVHLAYSDFSAMTSSIFLKSYLVLVSLRVRLAPKSHLIT